MNQIEDLIAQNRTIEAIKQYREIYHCSLREAKDAVDAMKCGLAKAEYTGLSEMGGARNQMPETPEMDHKQNRKFHLAIIIAVIAVAVFLLFRYFR